MKQVLLAVLTAAMCFTRGRNKQLTNTTHDSSQAESSLGDRMVSTLIAELSEGMGPTVRRSSALTERLNIRGQDYEQQLNVIKDGFEHGTVQPEELLSFGITGETRGSARQSST